MHNIDSSISDSDYGLIVEISHSQTVASSLFSGFACSTREIVDVSLILAGLFGRSDIKSQLNAIEVKIQPNAIYQRIINLIEI